MSLFVRDDQGTDQIIEYYACCDNCENYVYDSWKPVDSEHLRYHPGHTRLTLGKKEFMGLLRKAGWLITGDERCLCPVCRAYKKLGGKLSWWDEGGRHEAVP
jgi:hypothetical protein